MASSKTLLVITASAAIVLSATSSFATTTRVGNGDDGRDLEALTPITSGPIFTSRAKAVSAMKSLGVTGIPGLSALIPEIERTDLLLASADTLPTTEQPGSPEVSDDAKKVFARTFAEPYAATRFFPAAEQLSEAQLISLHVHEALHRALPAQIREDENVVSHITLALTSPGANYDRGRSVTGLYVKPVPEPATQVAAGSLKTELAPVTTPRTRTQISYELGLPTYETLTFNSSGSLQTLEFVTSLAVFQRVGPVNVEPVLRIRSKAYEMMTAPILGGTTSVDLQGRIGIDEQKAVVPFVRYTLGERSAYESIPGRDVLTIGAYYNVDSARRYLNSNVSYAFGSRQESDSRGSYDMQFGGVFSLVASAGFKIGKFRLGGIGELYSSSGMSKRFEVWQNGKTATEQQASTGSLRSILLGPEIGFQSRRFKLNTYAKWVLSGTGDLALYGDFMDHGLGAGQLGTSMALAF